MLPASSIFYARRIRCRPCVVRLIAKLYSHRIFTTSYPHNSDTFLEHGHIVCTIFTFVDRFLFIEGFLFLSLLFLATSTPNYDHGCITSINQHFRSIPMTHSSLWLPGHTGVPCKSFLVVLSELRKLNEAYLSSVLTSLGCTDCQEYLLI